VEAEAKLRRLEAIVDRAGIAERIEALLPVGVRPRRLSARTLLMGMLSVACEGRPAHLSRVHEALLCLPEAEQRRLGVIAEWKDGPHLLTYRQVERTFSLVAGALAKAEPDGEPCEALSEVLDALLEASVELCGEPETSSYAVDWTDLETFSVPPPKGGERCADPEAAWGHRRGNSPGERDEAFYGYYLQVVTAVGEERGLAVAELVRRIQIGSCEVDPPAALLELGPLHRGAGEDETAAHDAKAAELARHKLGAVSGYDQDGYRRVSCPAARGKLRCPLRPASMALEHTRPEVISPPEHPPTCCEQQTIMVPPEVNAKTAQKHDYPSPEHRRSYARRSAAERAYATVKDPASNDISKGWCRLTGLAPIALFVASVFVARNLRVADAFAARTAEEERRAAVGLPPRRHKRRRKSTAELIGAASAPP